MYYCEKPEQLPQLKTPALSVSRSSSTTGGVLTADIRLYDYTQ